MYQTNQQVYNTSNTNPTPSQLQQQQAQNIIIAPSDPTTTAQYIDYSHLNNSHVNNNNYNYNYNYNNHEPIHQYRYQSTPSANHFLSPSPYQQHAQQQYAYPMETTPLQSLKPRPFQEFEQYHRISPLEQRNYIQQQQQQQQNKQEKSPNLSPPDFDEASGHGGNNGTNSEVKPPVGQGGGRLGRVFRYFFSTNLMHPYHDKKPEELNKFQRFQKWLGETLESHWAQVIVVMLLVLDAIITAVELLLEKSENHRPWEKVLHKVLFGFTLAILGIFLVEIILKVIAFGWRFFTKFLFVFDAVIVIVSLTLEIIYGLSEDGVIGLLVLLRFWRVIRIVYSVAHSSHIRSEEKLEKLKLNWQTQMEEQRGEMDQMSMALRTEQRRKKQLGQSLKVLEDSLDYRNPSEAKLKEELLKIHIQLV